jgi:peptide-methionine (S)-S-oxide reductase
MNTTTMNTTAGRTMRVSPLRRAALLLCTFALTACAFGAEPATVIPPPAVDNPKTAGPLQTAVLAGGCFWGVQGVYQHVRGVRSVLSGYAGGEKSTAQYHTVGTGRTGHAESVQIQFDPQQVSYGELLQIYFSVAHDPTQLNRQGPDTGTQYRSTIFYTDDSQKKIAQAYIAQLDKAKVFDRPIVTTVSPNTGFYVAEDYHQDYLVRNPNNPYIVFNDLPKVRNLEKMFPKAWRTTPVTAFAANGGH